jgi:hypothetical protein
MFYRRRGDRWHNPHVAAPSPFARGCIECVKLETALAVAIANNERAFNEWLSAIDRGDELRPVEEELKRTQVVQDHARRAFSRHGRKCIAAATWRRYIFATNGDAEGFAALCRGEMAQVVTSSPIDVDVRSIDDAATGRYDRMALLAAISGPVSVETSSGRWKIEEPVG